MITTTSPALPHVAGSGLYRSIWRYADGARLALMGSVALLVGSQLLKLTVPWLAAKAINTLQLNGPQSLRDAGLWVLLLLTLYAGTWLLHAPGRILERTVGVKVRQGISQALFDKLTRAPLAWHDQHHSSEVQQRMSQASGALSTFAQNQYLYLQSAVSFVGPIIALVMLSQVTAWLAVIGYGIVALTIVFFDRALMRLAVQENAAERRFASGLLDFLGNIASIVGLRLQPSARRLIHQRLEAVFVPVKRSIVLNEAKWCSVDVLSVGLCWLLVIAYVIATRRVDAPLLIGSIFMVYQYAQQAGGVVGAMAANFQNFARTRVDFASADLIWNAPERPAAAAPLPADWQRMDVRDLCFEHASGGERKGRLQHVSISFSRGQRIALVGPSGSGKSTLMRVLAGLYDAQHGHVTVDGVTHLSVRPVATVTTLIPQEADVFEATVLENIAFDLQPDRAALDIALKTSAFDRVLAEMPAGLATPISERGFNLSGGQRQRLCLARGVLAAKDSALMLLDEPTSALDPLTEAEVFRQLDSRFPEACIVASVHRMSLLEHFDTVVLMEGGRVVDSGSAEDLRERQPLFAEMLRGQAGAAEAANAAA